MRVGLLFVPLLTPLQDYGHLERKNCVLFRRSINVVDVRTESWQCEGYDQQGRWSTGRKWPWL